VYQAKAVTLEAGMIPAAVAIALREGDAGPEALFIHRAERAGDTWSGQIAFPGGRREPSDPHLRATAIRETREEVGVELTDAEPLGVLDDMYPRTPVLPPVVVRPFVFGLVDRPPPPLTLSDEVQDAFWLSLRALTAPGVLRDVTIRVRDQERIFPAYVLENRTIWGMTERILANLLSLAKSTSSLDNIK
jgi:8-oxo-dGTP pyrophosphatase MutT (NUDIX family)